MREWSEAGDAKRDFKQFLEHESSDAKSSTVKVKEEDDGYSFSDGDLFPDQELNDATESEAEKACSSTKVVSRKAKQEQLDELLKTLCKDSPASDDISASLCQFKCNHCDKIYKGVMSLKNHCVKFHHTERFSTDNVERFLFRVVRHVCKICGDDVPCVSFFIIRHLSNMHRLKVGEYKEKYLPEMCVRGDSTTPKENGSVTKPKEI